MSAKWTKLFNSRGENLPLDERGAERGRCRSHEILPWRDSQYLVLNAPTSRSGHRLLLKKIHNLRINLFNSSKHLTAAKNLCTPNFASDSSGRSSERKANANVKHEACLNSKWRCDDAMRIRLFVLVAPSGMSMDIEGRSPCYIRGLVPSLIPSPALYRQRPPPSRSSYRKCESLAKITQLLLT